MYEKKPYLTKIKFLINLFSIIRIKSLTFVKFIYDN